LRGLGHAREVDAWDLAMTAALASFARRRSSEMARQLVDQ
jgi:hypothetical protein